MQRTETHEDLRPVSDHRFTSIVCCVCGHEISVPVYCGDRFCPVCSRPRLARVRRRISFMVNNTEKRRDYSFKHLTLTVRSESNLPSMLRLLTRSFRKLRQRSLWKKVVRGGAFVLEVKQNDGFYHAHIHAIIYSRWFDWNRLLDLWIKCSGNRGVYIQRIPAAQIVRYLTKYVSKPCDADLGNGTAREELAKMRLFQPFGEWFNLNKIFEEEKYHCPDCGNCYFLPIDILMSSSKTVHACSLSP